FDRDDHDFTLCCHRLISSRSGRLIRPQEPILRRQRTSRALFWLHTLIHSSCSIIPFACFHSCRWNRNGFSSRHQIRYATTPPDGRVGHHGPPLHVTQSVFVSVMPAPTLANPRP